jgi:hypothetical protein
LTVWFPFRAPDGDQPGVLIDLVRDIIPFLERFSDTVHAQMPEGAHYATPAAMLDREQSSRIRLERGTAKNIYLIRDDAAYPVQAVVAAQRIAEIRIVVFRFE